MFFKIRHHTRYDYSQAILLGPQQLRFRPRDNHAQKIVDYQLNITPQPAGINDHLDLEGNWVTQVWFEGYTETFEIEVILEVKTFARNAFNFILSPDAMVLPVNHENDSISAQAYLQRIETDRSVTAFAAELGLAANRDPLEFLNRLNRQLHYDFAQIHRESGKPQAPAFTLQNRRGACRDLAVLFVDCCRAEGIAARFASGYQKGDLQRQRRDLHAWPEVYLSGAGWLGFDPTHGDPVVDQHVTVSAAADSHHTMPVIGNFIGQGAYSSLSFKVEIEVQGEQVEMEQSQKLQGLGNQQPQN